MQTEEETEIQHSESLQRFLKSLEPYKRPGHMILREANDISLMLVELMVGNVDADLLKMASRFLRPEDYEDILGERNILHVCGYPLCNNDPKGINKEHQINWRRPSMVLPSTYLSRFCTREHYQASEFYENQLSEISVFSRPDIIYLPYGECQYEQSIVLLEEVEQLANSTKRSMKDIIHEFKALNLNKPDPRPPNDPNLVELSNEIKKVDLTERDVSIPRLDAAPEPMEGAFQQVEGYDMHVLQNK